MSTRIPHPVRRMDALLGAAADQMTPGQRWTAALGLGLAATLLLFGLPPRAITTAPIAVPSGPPAPSPSPAPRPPALVPAADVIVVAPEAEGVPVPAGGVGPAATDQPATAGLRQPAPAGRRAPVAGIVALTRGNPSGLPNRDDAAIAASFLRSSGISWIGVDAGGPAAATCAAAVNGGSIAVASQTLPPELASCLRDKGVTVLAFDEHGTGPGILSTRRGDVATFAELARWGRRSRRLTGRVGVVADGLRRADLEPAIAALQAAGVKVVATAWASGDTPGTAAMTTEVEAFARAGVDDVVMAAPVAVQREWAQRASVLGTRFAYVVSDVDDGVDNESYAPTFDGAVAHTSLRIHWFARDHGPTIEQRACADHWTASAVPAVLLAGEEAAVYAWCENVEVLRAAIAGTPIEQIHLGSPLTSDLGPLTAGSWGPTADASLVWRASCSCWRESEPFNPH